MGMRELLVLGCVSIAAVSCVPLVRWWFPAFDAAPSARRFRRSVSKAKRAGWIPWAATAFVMVTRALLLPWWKMPRPAVLDEFSYLLLADTFARGRLTNPAHPLWRHFETLFVLQQPTYASVYPVAQGFFLALGQVLLGHPWWGVWLSAGLMCAATAWAIQAWLPPVWAVFATAWVCLHMALGSYWIDSYWGGSCGAIGGSLVIGVVPRIQHRPRAWHGIILGTGFLVLANSRPYEGLILSATVVGYLIVWALRRRRAKRMRRIGGAFARALVVAVPGLLSLSFYCYRVTGSMVTLPAEEYMRQYAASPPFVWQSPPRVPNYRHEDLRRALQQLAAEDETYKSWPMAILNSMRKAILLEAFYLGPMFFFPVVMAPFLLRGRTGFLVVSSLVTITGILLTVPIEVHYGSPLACAFVIVAVQALRKLWLSRRFGNPIGMFLVPAAPVVCLTAISLGAFSQQPPKALEARERLARWLQGYGGQHLVIVHYGPTHDLMREWVYNHADIDSSEIVWARDMGAERNKELVDYYPRRHAWLALPDEPTVKVSPYNVK